MAASQILDQSRADPYAGGLRNCCTAILSLGFDPTASADFLKYFCEFIDIALSGDEALGVCAGVDLSGIGVGLVSPGVVDLSPSISGFVSRTSPFKNTRSAIATPIAVRNTPTAIQNV